MEETLTQKSHRSGAAELAITMLKVAIIKACHEQYWRNGAFYGIKSHSFDVDIYLEWLEQSTKITEAERTIIKDTRSKVADVQAYQKGRPTDYSSVDDLGWVNRLKSVFESQIDEDQVAGEASAVQKDRKKARTNTKPASREEDDGEGFETQRVYGGSGGPPKD